MNANKKVRVYDGVSNLHNGFQEFAFRTDGDLKTPVFASPADIDAQGNPVTSITTSNIFPFPKNKERDFLRGLLDEQTSFDRLGKKVSYQKHYYKFNNVKLEDPYSEDSPAADQYIPFTILGFTGGSFSHDNSANRKSRFGRYKVSADKLEKWKTEEKIYDQGDENKVFTKIDEFKYNAINGLVSNVLTYNPATPNSKVEAYTRYVVDDPYAVPAVGVTPSAESQALLDLRLKHQSATPVEQGTIFTDGSTTTRGSTIVYKYKPLSSFNRPSQVLGLAKPALNYSESKIDYNTGQFSLHGGFRILHSYDTYDATGNISQQTSFDGTVTKYVWGHNNSLVTKQVINPDENDVPSGFKQETNYTHLPLVGVLNVLDPNNVGSSYYYDKSHRLMYSTRYDGKIVNRYRYHYKGEEDMLTASLQVTGAFLPGAQMSIQVPATPRDRGTISYSWNFGDGTTQSTGSRQVFHAFSSANTYNVSVTISHPEYGSAAAAIPVTINPPISTTICVKGPTAIRQTCTENIVYAQGTLCGTSPYTSIMLTGISGGCGEYTYQWQFQINNGLWENVFGETGTSSPIPNGFANRTPGNYNVRCMITDKCSNTIPSDVAYLTVFRDCTQ
jgi:hypothetical protein